MNGHNGTPVLHDSACDWGAMREREGQKGPDPAGSTASASGAIARRNRRKEREPFGRIRRLDPPLIQIDLLSGLRTQNSTEPSGFHPDGLTYGPWTSRGREIPVTDKRVKHRSGQAGFSTPVMEGCEVAEVD
jgi:hypothetical protein